MIDLGDLYLEQGAGSRLPEQQVGHGGRFLSTHHGLSVSNAPAIVDVLDPRVAITNNGSTKGGTAEALHTILHLLQAY